MGSNSTSNTWGILTGKIWEISAFTTGPFVDGNDTTLALKADLGGIRGS
jgi:hypothetical protein